MRLLVLSRAGLAIFLLAYFIREATAIFMKAETFLGHFYKCQNKTKICMLQQLQMFRSYASMTDVNTMQAEF